MSLVNTLVHEFFHTGFSELGIASGDIAGSTTDVCNAETDPRDFAQTGECVVSAHAMTQYAAGQVMERAIFGDEYGWFTHSFCCSIATASFDDLAPGIYLGDNPAHYDPYQDRCDDTC